MKSASLLSALTGIAALLSGCGPRPSTSFQGYLEAEFVHVASPLSGQLQTLHVSRGDQVAPGGALFELEDQAEQAARRQSAERLRAAEATLADLRKGQRPDEIAGIEARLAQARASAELSQREFERQDALYRTRAISTNDLDRFRLTHERNLATVQEITALLATARLGARSDTIARAEADVAAARAAVDQAEWAVRQKRAVSAEAALVHDTLYRPGEHVPAGRPVVSLLPPSHLKIRFFVPEPVLASFPVGGKITVSGSSFASQPATVRYRSTTPEYTPPVLYNRDNRVKLVFLVEATFDQATRETLLPGQPVDVAPAAPGVRP